MISQETVHSLEYQGIYILKNRRVTTKCPYLYNPKVSAQK